MQPINLHEGECSSNSNRGAEVGAKEEVAIVVVVLVVVAVVAEAVEAGVVVILVGSG